MAGKPKGAAGGNQHTAISFDEEDTGRMLLELAICAGNGRLASERLKERGLIISKERLKGWAKGKHAERYQQLRRDAAPRIQRVIADEAEDLAVLYGDAERATLAVYNPTQISGKDLPGAIRSLAVAKAVNIDKAQLLRGNPTEITERRDPQAILDGIAARFPQLVVDAEVVEELPALSPPSDHEEGDDVGRERGQN